MTAHYHPLKPDITALTVAQKALTVAKCRTVCEGGDSFALTFQLTKTLTTITTELSPDIVIMAESDGELVLYAYERCGEAMKVFTFTPGGWLNELNAVYQAINDKSKQ